MSDPSHPFPGAAPTTSGTPARAAVVGRFAKCQLNLGGGNVDLALLFDWEVNIQFDYADATAHGDRWKQKVFLDADWRARARGYITPVAAAGYITALTASTGPILVTFTGYSDITATTILWAGPAYISRGRITVPMAMAEQEFELISSGGPTSGSNF